MKLLVTGGLGFLGRVFAGLASKRGAEVVLATRSLRKAEDTKAIPAEIRTVDFNDQKSVATAMRGVDAVIHAASPPGGIGNRSFYERELLGPVRCVASAMELVGVSRLIYISTISVHGLDPVLGGTISERSGYGTNFLPYDYYGRAKADAERLLRHFCKVRDSFRCSVIRPGWMYGPGDNRSYGLMADLLRRGIGWRVGQGDNILPLVHVRDVAHAIWLCLSQNPSRPFRSYICGVGPPTTQNDYAESLRRAANSTRRIRSLPIPWWMLLGNLYEVVQEATSYSLPRLAPSRHLIYLAGFTWRFDQSRICKELGFEPSITSDVGFAETEHWYRESRGISYGLT